MVNGTNNYWVSNNGRLVNNLRNGYYMHNTKSEKKKSCSHHTLTGYTNDNELIKIDTYIDKIVEEHFLYNPIRYDRVWHIDRDQNNNYYKNLVYVDYSVCDGESMAVDKDLLFSGN